MLWHMFSSEESTKKKNKNLSALLHPESKYGPSAEVLHTASVNMCEYVQLEY